MGSDETAITILGGPRVIDVFDGNGAPSGPNCLLFSDVYRLSDSLWDRSEVGWSLGRMRLRSVLSRELWIQNFGGSWKDSFFIRHDNYENNFFTYSFG